MRQWHVAPKHLCRQHLLGEHVEHHMFVGCINKGKSIEGYINDGLVEPSTLSERHDELVREMEARGYSHKSPLPSYQLPDGMGVGRVDREGNIQELLARCPFCRERISATG